MCDEEAAQYNDGHRNQSTLTGCVSRVWHKAKTVFLLSMTADALPVEVIVFHIDVMTIYLNKMIIFKTVGKKVLICPLIEPQLAKSPFSLFGIESRSGQQRCLLYTSDAADDTPCVDLGGRRGEQTPFCRAGIQNHRSKLPGPSCHPGRWGCAAGHPEILCQRGKTGTLRAVAQ